LPECRGVGGFVAQPGQFVGNQRVVSHVYPHELST
jgi:hypothetical protein